MTRALEAQIMEIPPSEWPQILRFYSAPSPLSVCRFNFRSNFCCKLGSARATDLGMIRLEGMVSWQRTPHPVTAACRFPYCVEVFIY
ncbi:hypothetical protein COLO4_05378 [Corchorus olitorius]|uniref:Uncharacterized protein n=1 Tax=Corchorus olitorius TaxID=93759 RepID=A0A1R3KR25_9ROSI|nr:hypothetical protein COLO4_05378 [Corchorus olitorius]